MLWEEALREAAIHQAAEAIHLEAAIHSAVTAIHIHPGGVHLHTAPLAFQVHPPIQAVRALLLALMEGGLIIPLPCIPTEGAITSGDAARLQAEIAAARRLLRQAAALSLSL